MANDHYVPRFYLKNFAVADKPGRVWCYQRNRRPTLRGVKSVASEEDYYSLKEADDSSWAEEIFSVSKIDCYRIGAELLVREAS